MSAPDAATVAGLIDTALDMKSRARPRTQQSAAGLLGPSDLGFCRAAAVFKIRQTPPSDWKSTRAADWGSALHEWVEDALRTAYPDWIIEADKVTATYRTSARTFEVSGTPDIIVPSMNAVLDIKTVDGYSYVKREGASQNHRYQRYTYAKGAAEMGILDGSKPLYVGNVYLDRSAREKHVYVGPIVEAEVWLEDEIGQWLEDIVYAIETGEAPSQDIAAPVCAQICEFFSICRGHLPDQDADLIEDPALITAAQMYAEASAAEKEAKKMKDEAKAMLDGHSGLAGNLQVRWTNVPDSNVPGYTRRGYSRLDVVPVRR